MAVLTGKKTGSNLSNWQYYVANNPNWKKLELQIENKQTTYLHKKKGNSVEAFGKPLKEKTKILVTNTKLVKVGKIEYAHVKLAKGNGKGLVPIGKIRKPTKEGKVGTTIDENIALRDLDKLIKSFNTPINIELLDSKGKTFFLLKGAIGARTVIEAKDPKADFVILDSNGKPGIMISHKKGGGPKAFQQFSGVSPKAGKVINEHKEVKQFLRDLVSFIKDDRLIQPVFRRIKDDKLKNYAIFGPDWKPNAKNFGINHVHVIGQGKAILKESKKRFTLILQWEGHEAVSGDLSSFKGDLDVIIGATFRNGRSFEIDGVRYKGARVSIAPFAFMKGRSGLKEI